MLRLLSGKVQGCLGVHALFDEALLLLLQTQVGQVLKRGGLNLIPSCVSALDYFGCTPVNVWALEHLLKRSAALGFRHCIELRFQTRHKLGANHLVLGRERAGHFLPLEYAFWFGRCRFVEEIYKPRSWAERRGLTALWGGGLQRYKSKGFGPLFCFGFC